MYLHSVFLLAVLCLSAGTHATKTCQEGAVYEILPNKGGQCGSLCNLGAKVNVKSVEECADRCAKYDGCKCAFYRKKDGLCSMKNVPCHSCDLRVYDDILERNDAVRMCHAQVGPSWGLCESDEQWENINSVKGHCGPKCNARPGLGPIAVSGQAECRARCMADDSCKCAFYNKADKLCHFKLVRCDNPTIAMEYDPEQKSNAIQKCTCPPPVCSSKVGCKKLFEQCGGELYSGSNRCCSDDHHCVVQNQYYAQCLEKTAKIEQGWLGDIISSC